MERLTDEEINCQYEILMQFECITVTREAAIQLLDEIICNRMAMREITEASDGH
ncbi:MAG: hypothetical protein ACFWUG_00505 [Rahnella inusitata]|jgi:hypothetical protein